MSAAQPATIVRRLGGLVANLLLVTLTLGAIAYVVPSFLGYERYVITGGSMTGSIDKGSIVFSKDTPAADLRVGDVITYLPPADSGVSTLVTHRILSMEPGENGSTVFRTQGDANPDPDPWTFSLVDSEQPVVQHAVPHVGWVMIAMADREIRMLVVGLPAAIIALMALVQLIGALRPSREDEAAVEAVPNCGDRVDVLSPAWAPAFPSVDAMTSGRPAPRHLATSGRR